VGTLTLQELRDEVRFRVRHIDPDEVPNTRVDLWIRLSYEHVAKPTNNHRELQAITTFNLVQGDRDYRMITDLGSGDYLWMYDLQNLSALGEQRRLTRMTLRAQDEQDHTIQRRPLFYDVFYDSTANELVLFLDREPGTANGGGGGDSMVMRYWRRPPALVEHATNPATILLPDWDEVIIEGAVWRGWKWIDEPKRAELAKIEFGQLINETADRLKGDLIDPGWTVSVEVQDAARIT